MSFFAEQLQAGLDAVSIRLDADSQERLAAHWRLVREYNRKFNLTAITGDEEAAYRHYVDCLLALPLLRQLAEHKQEQEEQEERLQAVDIGSGAGYPGLVLALACPESDWLLLEAASKKCGFLQLCIEELGIKNARALPQRAEQAGDEAALRGKHDLVVCRAVSALPVLLEYAAPLLQTGGLFAAMKGPALAEEQAAAATAQEFLAMCLLEQQEFTLPGGEKRFIAAYQKTADTPQKYPRRAGMPEKRPL